MKVIVPDRSTSYAHRPNPRKMPKTGNWGPAEDARLRQAVSQYGRRWTLVANEVGTRNGDQCAKRWKDKLDPQLDHSQWSPEEEQLLLSLVETYGHNWKFIAQNYFQSRAPLALKNRNSLIIRRLQRRANEDLEQDAIVNSLDQHTKDLESSTCSISPASHGSSSIEISPLSSPAAATTNSTDATPFFDEKTHGTLHHTPGLWSIIDSDYGAQSAPVISGSTLSASSLDCSRVDRTAQGELSQEPWEGLSWLQNFELMSDTENATTGMGSSRGIASSLPRSEGQGSETEGDGLSSDDSRTKGKDESVSSGVEYSVTCPRGKMKAVANHLMNAAVSEIAERTAESDNITIKLRCFV